MVGWRDGMKMSESDSLFNYISQALVYLPIYRDTSIGQSDRITPDHTRS